METEQVCDIEEADLEGKDKNKDTDWNPSVAPSPKKRKRGKPVDCDHCDYTASSATDLRMHKNVSHSFRYPCDQCEKSFSSDYYLRTHIRVRHDMVRYPCQDCHFVTVTPDKLKVHIASAHKGKGQRDIFIYIIRHLITKLPKKNYLYMTKKNLLKFLAENYFFLEKKEIQCSITQFALSKACVPFHCFYFNNSLFLLFKKM